MGVNLQSILLAGTLFFFGLVSPGPNFLVVIQSTLRGGQRSGIFTGLGAATGDGIYALIGLLGFSTLSAQGQWVFQPLKLVGAAYLTFLGIRMCLRRTAPMDGLNQGRIPGVWHCFLRGLATDLSNPKTILFFGSIFAPLILNAPIGVWFSCFTHTSALTCWHNSGQRICGVSGNTSCTASAARSSSPMVNIF